MSFDRNTGRIRNGQSLVNPLDNSFVLDERKTWDILSYMVEYMKLVHFYTEEDKKDGNWSPVLLNDPIFYKATIATSSLSDLDRFAKNFEINRKNSDSETQLLSCLINWYEEVQKWVEHLSVLGEIKLADKIGGIHKGIMSKMVKSLRIIEQNSEKYEASWAISELDKTYLTYQKVITYIKELTKENMLDAFFSTGSHHANNALYLAFVRLFEQIQKRVNTFPRRHLDFYYKNVIKQKPLNGKSTKAIVNFDLKKGVEFAQIQKGIKLSAGKQFNESQDTIFSIDKTLSIYPTQLKNLYSIYLKKGIHIKSGTRKSIISGLLFEKLLENNQEFVNLGIENRALFGADADLTSSTAILEDKVGKMGFIISSPVLFLSEGKREISFSFSLEKDTAKSVFWKLLGEISDKKGGSLKSNFKHVFQQAFLINYTGHEGWNNVHVYKLKLNEEENKFTIVLNLDVADSSVEILEEESFSWPAVKFELNPYAPIYAYSFLKGLKIDSVRIKTKVQEIRNLSVYNDLGQVDINKSFDIFGGIPKLGSSLKIAKSELFKKNITSLLCHIDWENLPIEAGGFETYFNRYPNQLTNESYKVNLSVLNKGEWIPNSMSLSESHNLFETEKRTTAEGYDHEYLKSRTDINYKKFRESSLVKNYKIQDPLEYSIDVLEGFIKLTFSGPDEAFGNEIYPDLVTQVSIHNARKKKNIPLPNRPFIPSVKSLKLSYIAEDSLSFQDAKSNIESTSHNISEFYYITPTGRQEVIKEQSVKDDTLLYDFLDEGQLFMEVEKASGAKGVSIYFDLDDAQSNSEMPKEKLRIMFKKGKDWMLFPEKSIINDDTLGLRKSGIIELGIPKIDGQESIWIKIAVQKEAEKYPYLKGIYFNAIEAHNISIDAATRGKVIKAHSINKIVGSYPDINSVNQANDSYGGFEKENEREFYGRVANRLRHKDRAVTNWDYEQLILDRFNDVSIVKCTNKSADFLPEPENVKLVILNKNWSVENFNLFSRDILFNMQKYIQSRSNPFVNLEVINPTFEYLLVNCTLELEEEGKGGHFISQINDEIVNYLGPESQINNGFGGLGGKIIPMILMSHLENLSFVKRGKYLSIEHIIRKGNNEYSLGIFTENKEIRATIPWSIMVPMENHNIDVVEDRIVEGIGHFQIGQDFILANGIGEEHKGDEEASNENNAWWLRKENIKEEKSSAEANELLVLRLNKKNNA